MIFQRSTAAMMVASVATAAMLAAINRAGAANTSPVMSQGRIQLAAFLVERPMQQSATTLPQTGSAEDCDVAETSCGTPGQTRASAQPPHETQGSTVPVSSGTKKTCVAYATEYPHGATFWCSARPGPGRACPLGLHFSKWICQDGRWVSDP